MHQVTPNWTWTRPKVPYVHYIITHGVQILVCFALRPAFSKISHILSFPIDYHVKRPKKEQQNLPKIQNLKFNNSLYNFGRDPS